MARMRCGNCASTEGWTRVMVSHNSTEEHCYRCKMERSVCVRIGRLKSEIRTLKKYKKDAHLWDKLACPTCRSHYEDQTGGTP